MKKIIVAFGVVALFAGTTSCKKDWTCTCSDSADSASFAIENETKKDADSACNELTAIYVGTAVSCSID